ncbi:predicted protein [Nematostella vectensis]|uniref:G-protein coupled receptors family 1 profile domain-containing protein n=1 Tax=Nematostella vectensis TaxID=45351 RepID=A7T528_NEMVE|nr:predicted protein [Nematostella vectensis]|eukprot:XP_001621034.1 hypothetical protein NEMVEDRAFT_v1g222438 [Nematostella vectensis]
MITRETDVPNVLFIRTTDEGIGLGLKQVFEIISTAFMSTNMISFAFIAIERMHATVWPLRHRNTKPRMYIVFIVVTWVSGLGSGGLTYVDTIKSARVVYCFVLISFAVLVVSYATIFIKIKKQNQLHNQSHLQRTIQKERELAKTLLLVTMTSLVTWLPQIGVGLRMVITGRIDYMTQTLAFTACGGNSLCNPVIYMFRMKEYRRAVKHLVCKCSRDRGVQPAVAHG